MSRSILRKPVHIAAAEVVLSTAPASVYALGKAVRGGVEKRFEWRFNLGARRHHCPGHFFLARR